MGLYASRWRQEAVYKWVIESSSILSDSVCSITQSYCSKHWFNHCGSKTIGNIVWNVLTIVNHIIDKSFFFKWSTIFLRHQENFNAHILNVLLRKFSYLQLPSIPLWFLHSCIKQHKINIVFSQYCSFFARDATIPFFQNRSDPKNSEDRLIPGSFFFYEEFLYFSVLTWPPLFCVLNTTYYSVSQLVCQKCWVCSPNVGHETVLSRSRTVYSQRNDINKNVILNAFLMRDFYFKGRAWKLLTLLSYAV